MIDRHAFLGHMIAYPFKRLRQVKIVAQIATENPEANVVPLRQYFLYVKPPILT